MKTLLTIFTLVFTVMFSSTSFAEWRKLGVTPGGETIYVDFERIRKHDGYVYFWQLIDYLKPNEFGKLSGKLYKQGDCNLFRFKGLSFVFHKQPKGRDTGDTYNPKTQEWIYPSPDSMNEHILKIVCSQ